MNYIEIHMKDSESRIVFEHDEFKYLLKSVSSKHNYPMFNKKLVKQFCDDMVLEFSYDSPQSQDDGHSWSKENVYSIITTDPSCTDDVYQNIQYNPDRVVTFFDKTARPIHVFPSTDKYVDCLFEDKTVFKINNLVYLNFARAVYQSEPDSTFYYVFVNYNDHVKCDVKRNVGLVNDVCKDLSLMIKKRK